MVLKVVRPTWSAKLELEPWRIGYVLPWAVVLPQWWELCWGIPFPSPRDMDFVQDLWIRRLNGAWP